MEAIQNAQSPNNNPLDLIPNDPNAGAHNALEIQTRLNRGEHIILPWGDYYVDPIKTAKGMPFRLCGAIAGHRVLPEARTVLIGTNSNDFILSVGTEENPHVPNLTAPGMAVTIENIWFSGHKTRRPEPNQAWQPEVPQCKGVKLEQTENTRFIGCYFTDLIKGIECLNDNGDYVRLLGVSLQSCYFKNCQKAFHFWLPKLTGTNMGMVSIRDSHFEWGEVGLEVFCRQFEMHNCMIQNQSQGNYFLKTRGLISNSYFESHQDGYKTYYNDCMMSIFATAIGYYEVDSTQVEYEEYVDYDSENQQSGEESQLYMIQSHVSAALGYLSSDSIVGEWRDTLSGWGDPAHHKYTMREPTGFIAKRGIVWTDAMNVKWTCIIPGSTSANYPGAEDLAFAALDGKIKIPITFDSEFGERPTSFLPQADFFCTKAELLILETFRGGSNSMLSIGKSSQSNPQWNESWLLKTELSALTAGSLIPLEGHNGAKLGQTFLKGFPGYLGWQEGPHSRVVIMQHGAQFTAGKAMLVLTGEYIL